MIEPDEISEQMRIMLNLYFLNIKEDQLASERKRILGIVDKGAMDVALIRARGGRLRAAKIIGMSRQGFYDKAEQLGVNMPISQVRGGYREWRG